MPRWAELQSCIRTFDRLENYIKDMLGLSPLARRVLISALCLHHRLRRCSSIARCLFAIMSDIKSCFCVSKAEAQEQVVYLPQSGYSLLAKQQ